MNQTSQAGAGTLPAVAPQPPHRHGHAGGRGLPGGRRAVLLGTAAAALMLGIYFLALTLVSGWDFTLDQFVQFWYFIVPLAAGFGVQVGLYTRLRAIVGAAKPSASVVAASGTTSTAAMVSCCAHYLANVAPVLGATGLVAFAAQFQVELFWAGLLFSAGGIAYVGNKVAQAAREHAQC